MNEKKIAFTKKEKKNYNITITTTPPATTKANIFHNFLNDS